MSSLNKVTLIGNVGQSPKISFTKDGSQIANFSLATSELWKDKVTGERKSKTEWHRIVVMNDRIVDVIDRFVRSGSRIYVEGQLQTRKWTDNSGVDRYSTEIIIGRFRGDILLLDSRPDVAESTDALEDKPVEVKLEQKTFDPSKPTAEDDDIPF